MNTTDHLTVTELITKLMDEIGDKKVVVKVWHDDFCISYAVTGVDSNDGNDRYIKLEVEGLS